MRDGLCYATFGMKRIGTVLGAILAFATGCPTTIVVDGTTVREDAWTEAAASVTARARTDLGCEEIKLKLLDLHPAGTPRKIGAAGCDKTATYVPGPDGWVAASAE